VVSFDTTSVSPVTAGSNYHHLVRIPGSVVYEKAETAKTELLSVSVGFLSLMDVNTALGRGGKLCPISVFRFGSLQLRYSPRMLELLGAAITAIRWPQ
jgi:hypothetical protein